MGSDSGGRTEDQRQRAARSVKMSLREPKEFVGSGELFSNLGSKGCRRKVTVYLYVCEYVCVLSCARHTVSAQ